MLELHPRRVDDLDAADLKELYADAYDAIREDPTSTKKGDDQSQKKIA
jgi:hypothetical protein